MKSLLLVAICLVTSMAFSQDAAPDDSASRTNVFDVTGAGTSESYSQDDASAHAVAKALVNTREQCFPLSSHYQLDHLDIDWNCTPLEILDPPTGEHGRKAVKEQRFSCSARIAATCRYVTKKATDSEEE